MGIQQTVRQISGVANAALAVRRFVSFNSSGKLALTGAQLRADGVTQEAASAAGKVIGIALPDGALVKVEAGAAVTRGADVSSDSTGRVLAIGSSNGNQKNGKAIEAATAAGDIIVIQFVNKGQVNA